MDTKHILYAVENGPLSIRLILIFGRIKLKIILKKVCIRNFKHRRIGENVAASEKHRLVLAVDCNTVQKAAWFWYRNYLGLPFYYLANVLKVYIAKQRILNT